MPGSTELSHVETTQSVCEMSLDLSARGGNHGQTGWTGDVGRCSGVLE